MSGQKYKSLDDLVFENRNREYGAFDMRMKENSNLMKAFIIGTFACLLILAFALSYDSIFKEKQKTETVVDINLQDVTQPDLPPPPEEEPPPPPEKEPEPEVATVKVVMPEPKPKPKVEETVPEIKEMDNKLLGLENKEGKETNSIKSINKPTEPDAKPAPVGNFTARQVSQMAVYPGCEKFAGDKNKLQQCLSEKLNGELGDQLSDFAETMSDRGETTAIAKLQFVIDKSGRIIQVQALKGGSVDLGRESEKALERIASRLASRGKTIQPAKLEDGSPVNLVFQLPVRYQIQN